MIDSEHRLITVEFADNRPRGRAGRRRGGAAGAEAAGGMVLAWTALIVTSPLFLMAVVGVRLSGPGPIFSRQRGIGVRGQVVELVKFRTTAGAGRPGLSGAGRLLRATGVDSLPHLLNLARGDISLFRAAPRGAAHLPRPVVPKAA